MYYWCRFGLEAVFDESHETIISFLFTLEFGLYLVGLRVILAGFVLGASNLASGFIFISFWLNINDANVVGFSLFLQCFVGNPSLYASCS